MKEPMPTAVISLFEEVFPACRSILEGGTWQRLVTACGDNPAPEAFFCVVARESDSAGIPAYLSELVRLEAARHEVARSEVSLEHRPAVQEVNPTLRLFQSAWKNLACLLDSPGQAAAHAPEPGEEIIVLWKEPRTGVCRARAATSEDLLVLKMTAEQIPPEKVLETGGMSAAALEGVTARAVRRGIILAPESRIRRDPDRLSEVITTGEQYVTARVFTLQWHVTQACDLHCKHCYDRSERPCLDLGQAVAVLDDLKSFCRMHHVAGQVTFTGGNPLLYPHFRELYEETCRRGFGTAVLGNPSRRDAVEGLLRIQKPGFFQVSLEGLEAHNDEIRGKGHFRRTMDFLAVLRDLGVYSMVMLTLTRDNIGQVIPLGRFLQGKADVFHFNRLALVGEGAKLHLPSKAEYALFLEEYLRAAGDTPVLGLKDNLLNILREKQGLEPFGGCAGFGCGAAFNFLALLPDGEVHACRKFPSPVGNVLRQPLAEIYHSEAAALYRAGSAACASCRLRPVCGGCLAISHSFNLDIFRDRDPFCFRDVPGEKA